MRKRETLCVREKERKREKGVVLVEKTKLVINKECGCVGERERKRKR